MAEFVIHYTDPELAALVEDGRARMAGAPPLAEGLLNLVVDADNVAHAKGSCDLYQGPGIGSLVVSVPVGFIPPGVYLCGDCSP